MYVTTRISISKYKPVKKYYIIKSPGTNNLCIQSIKMIWIKKFKSMLFQ